MNNNHVKEIKMEDKKAFKGFIIFISISGVIGFFLGFMSDKLKVLLNGNILDSLLSILGIMAPFASLILSIFIIIISKFIYRDARKKYDLFKDLDENEEMIEKVERKLGVLLLIVNINFILGYLFFGMSFIVTSVDNSFGKLSVVNFVYCMLGFIVCLISGIIIQKNVVNLEKENNPILKGSVYDIKFTKKWLDSCDEAIKLQMFKSAYKAYNTTSITCIILFIFCFIGSDIWNFGIMPMIMVTIIWLVLIISYSLESLKNSKRK